MKKKSKTRWHRLLGKLLEELLTPVGIKVYTEFPVMSETPETDILLLRKGQKSWTIEQFKLLPDGIRDSNAEHILIEFKYTESVNENVLRQALGYDTFYRRSHQIAKHDIQTFVVSSRTPKKAFLSEFGYFQTKHQGVYHSNNPILKAIGLISLNGLSDKLHNAFFKCFASRMEEKKSAFDVLVDSGANIRLQWIIQGLKYIWFRTKGDSDMKIEITPEDVAEAGKKWGNAILASMTPEERLAGLKPEDRLAGLKPEEILAVFKPEDRLAGLKPEEILARFKPEDRLAGLKPEEILAVFKPEDRLAGLKPEEIEAYLRKVRKKKATRKKV